NAPIVRRLARSQPGVLAVKGGGSCNGQCRACGVRRAACGGAAREIVLGGLGCWLVPLVGWCVLCCSLARTLLSWFCWSLACVARLLSLGLRAFACVLRVHRLVDA
ncbi:hypothetical protein V1507DRAFT_465732, partial [Lipomyces tetrasporus]